MESLFDRFEAASADFDDASARLERLSNDRNATPTALREAKAEVERTFEEAQILDKRCREVEAKRRARAQFTRMADGTIRVDEPDIYTKEGRSFFADLYAAQLKDDPQARARIDAHQRYEVETRAVTSATLGGIIPPAYLVDLYAKASRNGRVFADQVNHQTLPDVGMSLLVPRLTQGLAAGAQASENTAVSTQDPTETDLTVNVRTVAGYSPISRQGLERAAYSDQILFEDLTARYFASLDSQCVNGAGTSGTMLGLLQTAGIATSTVSTVTVPGIYPKLADLAQQISTNVGGIGYLADKIFMHPRRWGFFCAALDSSNRPLVEPDTAQGVGFNVIAVGDRSGGVGGGYGGPVGMLFGLPVYVDANIPTNLGTNTNEDRIIMVASQAVHLWERANDPVTLSFEQQAGTSLQVQLVVYGYAAFTAGRYPGASGAASGLTPPSF